MLQTSKLSSRSQSKSDSGFQIQQGQETCGKWSCYTCWKNEFHGTDPHHHDEYQNVETTGITKEQYKRLLTYCNIFIMEEKKFGDTNITSGAINFAGIMTYSSYTIFGSVSCKCLKTMTNIWILDFGVSHHMTYNKSLFSHTKNLPYPLVALPNSYRVKVTKVGSITLHLKSLCIKCFCSFLQVQFDFYFLIRSKP